MKIENLYSETKGGMARAAATVTWEDCERPTQEIFFETDEAFAQDLFCNPHAFLVASILPAMRHGEERVAIEAKICPGLRNGLTTAMGWICRWFGPPRKPVRIEAERGIRASSPRTAERVGSFLSGGIDSLTLLRTNRLDFPLDHPRSIRDCLFVRGYDIGGGVGAIESAELAHYQRALASLLEVAEDARITLIPVFTNVKQLDNSLDFWMYEFVGAALASVAHALSNRLTGVYIASTDDIRNLTPWGSHPLLDPNYSSSDLQVWHEGVRFSRFEKTKIVADWDVALQNLRVCTTHRTGALNCGRCEKCIRTMTTLLAIGKLDHTRAFPADDVSKDLLDTRFIRSRHWALKYHDLISPLRARGRHDLVEVIEKKLRQFDRRLDWAEERDWKGLVKQLDRRYLGGRLLRLRNRFKSAEVIAWQANEIRRLDADLWGEVRPHHTPRAPVGGSCGSSESRRPG